MLRNRSRAVTTKQKQPPMADHITPPSPSQNHNRPISSFFGSPRIFSGFLQNGPSETETTTMSPTSILEYKSSPVFANPFGYGKNLSKFSTTSTTFSEDKHSWENSPSQPKGISVALDEIVPKPNKKMVLFGSKLRIQIPPLSPPESPKLNTRNSFGSKLRIQMPPLSPQSPEMETRNSQFSGSFSPGKSSNSGIQTEDALSPKAGDIESLSISEIELSEDYTCVISRGPNPRTTHIYCNCVVEDCCGMVKLSELKKESVLLSNNLNSPSQNFLSFCHTCKKSLEQGKDIYMYRGEEAFCSPECRYQEMLFDGEEN